MHPARESRPAHQHWRIQQHSAVSDAWLRVAALRIHGRRSHHLGQSLDRADDEEEEFGSDRRVRVSRGELRSLQHPGWITLRGSSPRCTCGGVSVGDRRSRSGRLASEGACARGGAAWRHRRRGGLVAAGTCPKAVFSLDAHQSANDEQRLNLVGRAPRRPRCVVPRGARECPSPEHDPWTGSNRECSRPRRMMAVAGSRSSPGRLTCTHPRSCVRESEDPHLLTAPPSGHGDVSLR